jgi:hypothetical protein
MPKTTEKIEKKERSRRNWNKGDTHTCEMMERKRTELIRNIQKTKCADSVTGNGKRKRGRTNIDVTKQ